MRRLSPSLARTGWVLVPARRYSRSPSRLAAHVTGWFGEFTAIWLDASK
jgi:hypothetical protein